MLNVYPSRRGEQTSRRSVPGCINTCSYNIFKSERGCVKFSCCENKYVGRHTLKGWRFKGSKTMKNN